MSAKNSNLKIGIFILIAFALLIAGVLAFGAKSYFSPKTHFETAVEGDVAGLSVGSSVQLRGVPIGKVTLITFSWDAYRGSKSQVLVVEFDVDNNLMPWPPGDLKTLVQNAVDKGLRASVKSQGITGSSLLSVELIDPPPTPPVLDYTPRYYYIPSVPGQFTRILETVENALSNLEKLDFGSIGQGLTNALGGVRQLSDKLDRLDLETIATNANSLLVDFRGTSAKLNEAIGQIQKTLDEMKLAQLSHNTDKLMVRLSAVPLHDTLSDLQQTLQNLDEVLIEMKRYPAGFFLGEPPVPARAVQPVRHSK
jgi:ABC-type transporter Mla subunit MlaD